MSLNTLDRRVAALEKSAPIIDDFADFVVWKGHGCDSHVIIPFSKFEGCTRPPLDSGA